ncbi:hypothetical protein T10_8210 [Trichinella papuae]|uniref:Uncharacterized protein n=1 Tax=Trichinella papuae TaxID=268474 RepID=A0A0V1N0B7_9BILA|nr:hypothetical protein T10_8210 [Trichinella papuae]
MQKKRNTSEDSVTLMENMYLTAGSYIHEQMTAVTEQLTGDNVQSLRETCNLVHIKICAHRGKRYTPQHNPT